ncbi:hypothetical protein TURU_033333 [Turdus rufiventris]|nr:hypothetical protein TURU_033333 [Turdus rufiventris]
MGSNSSCKEEGTGIVYIFFGVITMFKMELSLAIGTDIRGVLKRFWIEFKAPGNPSLLRWFKGMNIIRQVQQEFLSPSVEHTIPALEYECKYFLSVRKPHNSLSERNIEPRTSKEPKLSQGLEHPDVMIQHSLDFHDSLIKGSIGDPPGHAHRQKAPITPGSQVYVLEDHKIQFCMAGVSTQSPWGHLVSSSVPMASGKPNFLNGNMDHTWKRRRRKKQAKKALVFMQEYSTEELGTYEQKKIKAKGLPKVIQEFIYESWNHHRDLQDKKSSSDWQLFLRVETPTENAM